MAAGKENHKALAGELAELRAQFQQQQKQFNETKVSILTQFQKILPPGDLVARTGTVCYECSSYCCTLLLIIVVGGLAIASGVLGTQLFWFLWAILKHFIPGMN